MSESRKLSDEELVAALKNGDKNAFTQIYKEYWQPMFRVACQKLRNRELAEEMVQDIFTRLWKERATVRITHLNYYLFAAIRYEIIDHIRTSAVKGQYEDYYLAFASFEALTTDDVVDFNDLVNTIDQGLQLLPSKSKEIFRLNHLEHWPVDRIASHFNLSEKAVAYHLAKATKSIRLYLNEVFVSLTPLVVNLFF